MAQRRRRKRRRIRIGRIFFLLFLIGLLCVGLIYLKYQNAQKPVQKESEEVVFTVNYGDSLKAVTSQLEKENLIKDEKMAYYFAKFNHLDEVKAGDYTLNKNMTTKEIFEILNDSSQAIVNDTSVTIIEGDWAKDIAKKISAVTNVSADELLSLWSDETYIRSLIERYPFITEDVFNPNIRIPLEGYLAPNTYRFYQETTPTEVTEKILDQSLAVYQKYENEFKQSSYSIHELYTLASIIQYEAGKIEDMKMIAGVFYNRLNIDMPLQSSATVCYAIDLDKENDDWIGCEVNGDFESPYNTYKYAGLPPGPIFNAGEDAFDAVLHPTDNDYYYFLADVYGDGAIHYARTLDEHLVNQEKYLGGHY